jgi:hypothetical protein
MVVSPGKAICIALAAALFASAAIAGWRYLPLSPDRIEPASADITPIPVPKTSPVREATIAANAPVADVASVDPETAKPESAIPVAIPPHNHRLVDAGVDESKKKELPKGKDHDRQQALLASMIAQLHGEAYQRFINQPGFGMSRMAPTISVMPREWKMPEWTSEELTKEQPPIKGQKDLELIHRLSLNNFGNSPSKSEPDRRMEMAKQAQATCGARDAGRLRVGQDPGDEGPEEAADT